MKHLKRITTSVVALGVGFASAGTFSAEPVRHNTSGSGADTLTLEFQSLAGGGDTVVVDGRSLPAGHIVHEILSGPGAGTLFATFCVEIQQNVASGPTVYDIVDLTDARTPGPSLTQAQADGINAVVANAVALGWIDGRLQADSGQANFVARMAAVQAAIWDAMDLMVDVDDAASSDDMRLAYQTLLDNSTFDPTLRLASLRALSSQSGQDMLYVVPLPPAAWAGAGLLAVGFGVRVARRRG